MGGGLARCAEGEGVWVANGGLTDGVLIMADGHSAERATVVCPLQRKIKDEGEGIGSATTQTYWSVKRNNSPEANESAIQGGLGRPGGRRGTVQTASQTARVKQLFSTIIVVVKSTLSASMYRLSHLSSRPGTLLPSSTPVLVSLLLCSRPCRPTTPARGQSNNSSEPASIVSTPDRSRCMGYPRTITQSVPPKHTLFIKHPRPEGIAQQ